MFNKTQFYSHQSETRIQVLQEEGLLLGLFIEHLTSECVRKIYLLTDAEDDEQTLTWIILHINHGQITSVLYS